MGTDCLYVVACLHASAGRKASTGIMRFEINKGRVFSFCGGGGGVTPS